LQRSPGNYASDVGGSDGMPASEQGERERVRGRLGHGTRTCYFYIKISIKDL